MTGVQAIISIMPKTWIFSSSASECTYACLVFHFMGITERYKLFAELQCSDGIAAWW